MNTEGSISAIRSLLLLCTQPAGNASAEAKVCEAVRAIPNWAVLLGAAAEEGVAPLVCQRLDAVADGTLPAGWREQFRAELARSARRNLVVTAELFRVLAALEAEGVCAVPYKGPVVAAQAYGDIALRQFADLDIVVPQAEIVAAQRALEELGYHSELDPAKERDSHFIARGTAGQHSFCREGALATIELHTERTLRYFPAPLDWKELRPRLRTIPVGGGSVRTFSPEDTLSFLSVHGTKHFWGRLCWIRDLSGLARAPQEMDWELAGRIASDMRCSRMVLLGLALANSMLDAPLPNRMLDAIHRDSAIGSLCREIRADFFRQPRRHPGLAQRLRFRLKSYDSFAEGARQVVRLTIQPTEDDWQAVPLPRMLEPLYGLVRPWRLLRKHGLGLTHRDRARLDLAGYPSTSAEMAERMLRFAGVSRDDLLYDLGCGDGRIVVTAAKELGIRSVGVDSNAGRIAEARANASRTGVGHLVEFRQQDVREVDLSSATVVTMHLSVASNLAMLGKLQGELRPGARVVSRDFPIPVWPPDAREEFEIAGDWTTVFLWRIQGR